MKAIVKAEFSTVVTRIALVEVDNQYQVRYYDNVAKIGSNDRKWKERENDREYYDSYRLGREILFKIIATYTQFYL